MNVVLLRVGIDTGCGGIHSPIFADGTFEFLPIPDDRKLDERRYGNTLGRKGRALVEYFPSAMQDRAATQSMHVDPEFETFTYGDPTPTKRGLARLSPKDLLVFYAGMEGWGSNVAPALYLIGYFEVKLAGFATRFSDKQLHEDFAANYHVRHRNLFAQQRDRLILVKGSERSRLFQKAHRLGRSVRREDGTCWQVISPGMAGVFGRFGGIGSLQRSNPRWVDEDHIRRASDYVRSLH